MLNAVQQLWVKAVPESAVQVQTVYVEGVANLVGSQEDRERLREVLTALEAKQRLVELLNAYIDARQESVRVVFDLEERSEEHTSELQSHLNLVCRLLLEKKKYQ